MPIDINGLPNTHTQASGDRNILPVGERKPVGQNTDNGRSSVKDTVSFSDTAVRLGRLGVAVDDTPVVDTQRVEQARQAIQDGTYNVNPARIAEKMMALENLLSGKK